VSLVLEYAVVKRFDSVLDSAGDTSGWNLLLLDWCGVYDENARRGTLLAY